MRTNVITGCLLLIGVLAGCGGSSSDSGMLIEGTLVQGGEGVEHARAVSKHEGGEKLENVKVCTLGECSTTDDQGQWGMVVNSDFTGGETLITVSGHGIDSSLVVDIPQGASEVVIELENHGDEGVHAHSVVVDDHDDHDEDDGHSHHD